MRPGLYTQDMRANMELCPYCGMWHSSMGCPPQFAVPTMRIKDLERTVTNLRKLLVDMDTVAERIMAEYLFWADLGKCPPELILYEKLFSQLHARVQLQLEAMKREVLK